MLHDLGIEKNRFRLEWISASEGDKVKKVVNEMVEQVRALGPLDMPGKFADWDKEMQELEARVNHSQKEIPAHVH
jgi:F420-non-reducing hydrogenase iron-sulfur subunit